MREWVSRKRKESEKGSEDKKSKEETWKRNENEKKSLFLLSPQTVLIKVIYIVSRFYLRGTASLCGGWSSY